MNDWPVTLSLPVGLTVGGVTTWAIQLGESLARTGRRVRLVAHAADEGYPILNRRALGLDQRLEVIDAPSLKSEAHWTANVELYRGCLPTILLPNIWAESFAVAAALSAANSEAIRLVAWNH